MPDELNIPPLPAGCEVLWGVFLQLHNMRQAGMGASPISASDLLAYQRLYGVQLNSWELESLHALDQVAMKAAAEQNKQPTTLP